MNWCFGVWRKIGKYCIYPDDYMTTRYIIFVRVDEMENLYICYIEELEGE